MTIITKILTMANSLRQIKFVWSIKGYHVFRVRPHPNTELQLVSDPTNPYDHNAMKVMMPLLTEIPEHLQLDPSVRQNAGRQVGRVPANLCRAFKLLLERNLVHRIYCLFDGTVTQSSRPGVHQRYQRARHQQHFDRPGGGAELKCISHLDVQRRQFRDCMRVLEECVPLQDLDQKLFA